MDEHKLVYTKLHKNYEKIVEGHLQRFRTEQDITEAEFYSRVRASTDESELALMVVELVLCCSEYQVFVDLMRSKNRQMNLQSNGAIEEKC